MVIPRADPSFGIVARAAFPTPHLVTGEVGRVHQQITLFFWLQWGPVCVIPCYVQSIFGSSDLTGCKPLDTDCLSGSVTALPRPLGEDCEEQVKIGCRLGAASGLSLCGLSPFSRSWFSMT